MKHYTALFLCAALTITGPSLAQRSPDVVPMEDWSQFDTVQYRQSPLKLHLRTGYQVPVIMPEPVVLQPAETLSGLHVEVDTEVIILSPSEHFATRSLTFRGLQSGNSYHLAIRADALGSRKPVKVEKR